MTHDDVIRMAREVADPNTVDPLCGGDQRDLITLNLDEMVRFAALVAAEKDKQIAFLKDSHDAIRELAYKTGAEEEREACAQIVEREALAYAEPVWAVEIVNDIRARGEA